MLSFALYLLGSIVCISGLAWVATMLGAAQLYVNAGAALLLVLSLCFAAIYRRAFEPPAT
jgi:hypothetical protein